MWIRSGAISAQTHQGMPGLRRAPAAFLAACIALLTAVLPGSGRATESGVLERACAGAGDPELCSYYVAGFLDGALLTDTAIVAKANQSNRSDFFERAYATRVGVGRGAVPATALADFCLPVEQRADDTARTVVAHLAGRQTDSGRSLQDRVYDAVRELFPCEAVRGQ